MLASQLQPSRRASSLASFSLERVVPSNNALKCDAGDCRKQVGLRSTASSSLTCMKIKHYFSEMSACRGALAPKAHKPIHRWWTEFIFVDLTIACIPGFVYAVLIMGMRPLHP